jgi:hypothetical protein
VHRLEDEGEIRRLMAEMMATADDRDHPDYAARMAGYYTDDGQWTSGTGFADVAMAGRGRAALLEKFTMGTRIRESSHLLGTESVKVKGDEGRGTWLCFEPASLEGPGGRREAVWIMGRYACEFRREDGAWRVRTVRYDGIFCTPYEKGWTAERFVSIHPEAVDT